MDTYESNCPICTKPLVQVDTHECTYPTFFKKMVNLREKLSEFNATYKDAHDLLVAEALEHFNTENKQKSAYH